jgi:hypothetical protein
VAVTFDASLTPPGVHIRTLRITSNDPITPVAVVDTSFTVIGHPDIAIDGVTHNASSVVSYTSNGDHVARVHARGRCPARPP